MGGALHADNEMGPAAVRKTLDWLLEFVPAAQARFAHRGEDVDEFDTDEMSKIPSAEKFGLILREQIMLLRGNELYNLNLSRPLFLNKNFLEGDQDPGKTGSTASAALPDSIVEKLKKSGNGRTSKTALGTLNLYGTRRLRDDPTLTLLQSSTVQEMVEVLTTPGNTFAAIRVLMTLKNTESDKLLDFSVSARRKVVQMKAGVIEALVRRVFQESGTLLALGRDDAGTIAFNDDVTNVALALLQGDPQATPLLFLKKISDAADKLQLGATYLLGGTEAKLAETNQFWLFVPDQLITERSTVAMDIFGLVITGIPHLLSHFLDSEIDGVKVSTAAHFMVSTANVHGEKLIDDGGLPLNSASLAAVGSEVSALYQELIYQAQQCKKIDKDVRIRFDDLSYAVQAVLRRSAELFKMTFRGVQRSRINLSQYKLTWDFANLAKGTVGKLDTSFVSGSSGTGSLPSSPSTGSEAQSMQPTFGPRDEENDLRFSQDSQDVVSTAVDAVICFHTQGTPLTFHDGDGNAHRLTYDQLLDQSPDFMEGCHDFVQRLFPLDKESQNVESPILSVQQIQELPKNSILRAAGIMELFFTYQYEMGNMNGHNNLRVTRILKCLALCGLSREAREFRDFAVGLTGISTASREYWDPVIDELTDELDSDQELASVSEFDSDQQDELDSDHEPL